jgi:pantoate--beta-alanine ligase
MMTTVHNVAPLREQIRAWRAQNLRIALVPTMGNLHRGHFSLIDLAKQHADRVVASVFVNPTQFGPNEDFTIYPRTLEADTHGLATAHCDLLFAPGVSEVYPNGLANQTRVRVPIIENDLCGAVRPGHFEGVATVVCKLFNMVTPDLAVFGEKDLQQLRVIQKFVKELNIAVEILGAPTRREANGLAMSSRNQYLTADEHDRAGQIFATLEKMRQLWQKSDATAQQIQRQGWEQLELAGMRPDYVEIRDYESLDSNILPESVASGLVAARLGKTRLIDNLMFGRRHL